MEYTGAVGMMIFDELAYVNRQTKLGMWRAMTGIEREVTRVDEVVTEHMTLIVEAQGNIENLIAVVCEGGTTRCLHCRWRSLVFIIWWISC